MSDNLTSSFKGKVPLNQWQSLPTTPQGRQAYGLVAMMRAFKLGNSSKQFSLRSEDPKVLEREKWFVGIDPETFSITSDLLKIIASSPDLNSGLDLESLEVFANYFDEDTKGEAIKIHGELVKIMDENSIPEQVSQATVSGTALKR